MSYADDMAADMILDEAELRMEIEKEAKLKIWTTRDGTKINVKDMTTEHLQNTINYIKRSDSQDRMIPWIVVLSEELERRKELDGIRKMTNEEAKRYLIKHCNPDYPQGKLQWEIAINRAIDALERPTGEWVKATGVAPPEFTGRYVCSNCGHYALMNMPYGNRQKLSYFCPNCGADMRGGQE